MEGSRPSVLPVPVLVITGGAIFPREKCCGRFPFTNVVLSPGTVLGDDVGPLESKKEEEAFQALMQNNFIEAKKVKSRRT